MKALLCMLMLAMASGTSFAMSGREYLDHCRTTTVYDRAQCMGYLDAILRRDAEIEIKIAQTMRPAPYCLPTGVQLPLLRDVVVRMLDQFPARRLRGDAGPLIRGVLTRTYPPQASCDN